MTQEKESYEFGVHIVVVSVHPDSHLRVGTRYELRQFPVTLGRSLDAGVLISDMTVSREHAHLELEDGRLWLHAVSERAMVWVNHEQIRPGTRVELSHRETFVQLGGVLLKANLSPPTEPFQRTLQPPSLRTPLLRIEWTDETVLIALDGKEVSLHRGPSYVLSTLAMQANESVREDTLLLASSDADPDRALGRNLNQLVTYARNALASILEGDDGLRALVQEEVLNASVERGDTWSKEVDVQALDARKLVRQLIKNIRNYGYALRLPPEVVEIIDHRRG